MKWFRENRERSTLMSHQEKELSREQPKLSHQMTPEAIARAKAAPPARVAKPKPTITHTFRLEMTPSDLRIILDKMKKVQETYKPGGNQQVYIWYADGAAIQFCYKPKEAEK